MPMLYRGYVPEKPQVKYARQMASMPKDFQDLVVRAYKISESTPETARWALSREDRTSLEPTKDESEVWLTRLVRGAQAGIPAVGFCTWGLKRHLEIVSEVIAKTPGMNFAATSNFPHGSLSPAKARQSIFDINAWMGDVPNPREIDSVADYRKWIKSRKLYAEADGAGDPAEAQKLAKEADSLVEKVRAKFRAEREATMACGMTWKLILKANVHAAAPDPYQSLYDLATLALEEGADCVKTCTGMAAAPPYNDFVSEDVSKPENIVPMIVALRDFNEKHGTHRFLKISGGQLSEVDAARVQFLVREILGEEALDTMVFGAGYRFRERQFEYLGLDVDQIKPRVDASALPVHLRGLPRHEDLASLSAPQPVPATRRRTAGGAAPAPAP